MINRVILVGRLTKDPVLRRLQSGASTVAFTLAVDKRRAKNADPNQPTADFINCVAWNQTAETMSQYLHKGSLIGVEGRISTRNYDDPNAQGRKVYVTEVVCETFTFLESKNSSYTSQSSSNNSYYPDDSYNDVMSVPGIDVDSDDLPF